MDSVAHSESPRGLLGPISGPFAEKCVRFLKFLDFASGPKCAKYYVRQVFGDHSGALRFANKCSRTCEVSKIQQSYTLLGKRSEHLPPEGLSGSQNVQRKRLGPPEHVGDVLRVQHGP